MEHCPCLNLCVLHPHRAIGTTFHVAVSPQARVVTAATGPCTGHCSHPRPALCARHVAWVGLGEPQGPLTQIKEAQHSHCPPPGQSSPGTTAWQRSRSGPKPRKGREEMGEPKPGRKRGNWEVGEGGSRRELTRPQQLGRNPQWKAALARGTGTPRPDDWSSRSPPGCVQSTLSHQPEGPSAHVRSHPSSAQKPSVAPVSLRVQVQTGSLQAWCSLDSSTSTALNSTRLGESQPCPVSWVTLTSN